MAQSNPPALEGQDLVNFSLIPRRYIELYPTQRGVSGRHAGNPLIGLQNESEVMDLSRLHQVMLYGGTVRLAFQLNLLPLGPRV
jgi:hypothetical protein